MKKRSALKVLLLLAALSGLALPSRSDVKVNEGNGVNVTMENDAMKLNIAVEGGGRISSLVDKKSGKNLVTEWNGFNENGGSLDDRNIFTSFNYRASVQQPGGKVGVVRMSARPSNGMEITKILTLRDDSSALEVSETFSNGTQKAARFMLRSFLLPDGGPITAGHQYFVPVKGKPLQPLSPANGYYADLSAPWSAVWNSQTGNGVLVAAPGVNRFYFWHKGNVEQTYEWVYPEVPAGKSITVNYVLQLVHDTAPNWPTLSAAALQGLRGVRFADVPGWQNEEQRFKVTDAERARGFWLSTGDGDGKRRLPELRIDAPLNQSRSVYIAINALKDLTNGDLQIDLQHIPQGLVQTAWEVSGADSIKVLSFNDARKIDLGNGTEGRLWLTLQGGAKAAEAKGDIQISLNGQKVLLPLTVKVWPVRIPGRQPLDVKSYAGAGLTCFTGSYEVTPESVRQANVLFRAFNDIGGSMMSWAVNWPRLYPHLKIAGSDVTVADWIKKNRPDKPASGWPEIDFSYYDPFVNAAKSNGVTWAGTSISLSSKEKPISAEQEWMLIQLKKYLQKQGFRGFYCKIADEIAEEQIPQFIESAKVARRAGWRTGTTFSPRTAHFINTINPYCDVWEVGKGATGFFRQLLTGKYELEEKTLTLPADKWKNYRNGGAENTLVQQLFQGPIPLERSEVQSLQVLQNGQPLRSKGGSPWGNKERGVFFGGSNYLYISSLEKTDLQQSTVTVKYTMRVAATSGETLAKIDATDRVFFYGGGSRPYRNSYGAAAAYPLKAIEGGYAGFGWYDFYRWNADKILWYDAETSTVSYSPAYIGLRDGWNDVCLMSWLAETKKVPVSTFISGKADAPLRMGEKQSEIYRWQDVVNLTDPFMLNEAREKTLQAAMKG